MSAVALPGYAMDIFYAGNEEQSAMYRVKIQKDVISERENQFLSKEKWMSIYLHDWSLERGMISKPVLKLDITAQA